MKELCSFQYSGVRQKSEKNNGFADDKKIDIDPLRVNHVSEHHIGGQVAIIWYSDERSKLQETHLQSLSMTVSTTVALPRVHSC